MPELGCAQVGVPARDVILPGTWEHATVGLEYIQYI